MTKEVLVSVSGLQMAASGMESGEDEPIEIISPGSYYFKDGTHYIFYEEACEGFVEVTKTQIRLKGKEVLEVSKKGICNMHMVFESGKNNRCYYTTPYGKLNLGICTNGIWVDETEDNVHIRADYALDVDFEPVADCTIRINIKPRASKQFSIHDKMTF